MTYQEAIERIKIHNEHHSQQERFAIYITEALNMAIEALEKQIPKEPLNIEETKYKVSYKCPVCGTVHVNGWCGTNWKLPFCSICGQALDWSNNK